jgi:hypothetical protein
MRVVIWLAFPVLVFSVAVLYAIIMNWSQGVPFCDTWMRPALPYCQPPPPPQVKI